MSAVVDKLLVVGLGLIGGSLARALRASGFAAQISGYGYRVDSLRKGLEQGVIDSYSLDLEQALHDVDIVVISTPTLTAADLLRQILPRVSAGHRGQRCRQRQGPAGAGGAGYSGPGRRYCRRAQFCTGASCRRFRNRAVSRHPAPTCLSGTG